MGKQAVPAGLFRKENSGYFAGGMALLLPVSPRITMKRNEHGALLRGHIGDLFCGKGNRRWRFRLELQ